VCRLAIGVFVTVRLSASDIGYVLKECIIVL
jgi:hypothetical protein